MSIPPLGRAEVRKAIRFGSPPRCPTASLLPCTPELERKHGARLEALRARCPEDVVSTNITIDYWEAPPDDPDYRFAFGRARRPSGAALDAQSVIARWSDLDRFLAEFPTAWREEPMRRVASLRARHPDRYLLVSFGHYFVQRLASLRGATEFLADLHLHPGELRAVMDRLLELYATWAARVREAGADGVQGGDDLGTQRGLFFSPATFRDLIAPSYRGLAEAVHAQGLDLWLHSCGDVSEILGDLVDCGVDVIHPIQAGAMDPEPVARRFGGRVAFHLGMDVQELIPRGPPERIRAEILRRASLFLRDDGGTILGAGNVLTEDIPIEHIEAYVDAVAELVAQPDGRPASAMGRGRGEAEAGLDLAKRRELARCILDGRRPDRLPMDVFGYAEYRKDVYHLGEPELAVRRGEVASSADGRRRYTQDGGVWVVDYHERFRDAEDVLALPPERWPVEEAGPSMLEEMRRLLEEKARTHVPAPWHYGTLVTRATLEFGWEAFLTASALEPDRFGRILDRFGAASLAVLEGWARCEGVELVIVHDDIAGTRGLIVSPEWLRRRVYPWYRRFFDALHAGGKRALWVSDGNYLEALDDILATGPDGLYCECSSMDPEALLERAGPKLMYMVKTDSRTMDHGSPVAVRVEIERLRRLHERFPGMFIYSGGGNVNPANERAFRDGYREILVYG